MLGGMALRAGLWHIYVSGANQSAVQVPARESWALDDADIGDRAPSTRIRVFDYEPGGIGGGAGPRASWGDVQ